ncbi:MAG: FHA domain-containing protein [Infirmifilum sp.]
MKVGLSPSDLTVSTGDFTVKIDIGNGADSVFAGEFNIAFNSSLLELTNITPGAHWQLFPRNNTYVFYRKPEAGGLGSTSTLATLTFSRKSHEAAKTTLRLTGFKAADSAGKDLSINVDPGAASVTLLEVSTPSPSAPPQTVIKRPDYTWLVVATALLGAITAAAAVYAVSRRPAGYLVGPNFSFAVRGSRTFGREDFAGFLHPHQLNYLTRKSGGGQFTIVARKGRFYIIDNHSTNGTVVDGVNIKGRGYVPLNNGSIIEVPNVLKAQFLIKGK